jgi:hypothetical protein
MILGNCPGQFVSAQVMVLIGPPRGVGDLVWKSCRRQNLRQKRVGIKGNPRHESVELFRRVRRRRTIGLFGLLLG